MKGHKFRATENSSDVDHLISMKGIQVTKPLEGQSRARRASDADMKSEFIVPGNWRVNGETATENV